MAHRYAFMDLPDELFQIEIAQYLDIASYGFLSSTSVAIHRLLTDQELLWEKWVRRDLTHYPDLKPGENYQAYYKRMMQREWCRFRLECDDPTIQFAFTQGLECLARRLLRKIDLILVADDLLKLFFFQIKADYPEMGLVFFELIHRLPPINPRINPHRHTTKEDWITFWVASDFRPDKHVITPHKMIITSFFNSVPFDVLVNRLQRDYWQHSTTEKIRLTLFMKYVILNDADVNSYLLTGLSAADKINYIKAALIYVLSTSLFPTSHVILAVDSLLDLLPTSERLSFTYEFLNERPACINKLANYFDTNYAQDIKSQLSELYQPLGYQWYLSVKMNGYQSRNEKATECSYLAEVALIMGGAAMAACFDKELTVQECGNLLKQLLSGRASKKMLTNFFSLPAVDAKKEDILFYCFSHHSLAGSGRFLENFKHDFPSLPWTSIVKKSHPLNLLYNVGFNFSFYVELFRESFVEKLSKPNDPDEQLDWLHVDLFKIHYHPLVGETLDLDRAIIMIDEYLRAGHLSSFLNDVSCLLQRYDLNRILDEIYKYDAINQTRLFSAFLQHSLVTVDQLADFLLTNVEKYNAGSIHVDGMNLVGADRFDWIRTDKVKNLDKAIFLSNDELNNPALLKERVIKLHENQHPETLERLSPAILGNILRYAHHQWMKHEHHHALEVLKVVLPIFGKRPTLVGDVAGQLVNTTGTFFARVVGRDDDELPTIAAPTARQEKILTLMAEIRNSMLIKPGLTAPLLTQL